MSYAVDRGQGLTRGRVGCYVENFVKQSTCRTSVWRSAYACTWT